MPQTTPRPGPLSRRKLHLILDWDGTITKNDTLKVMLAVPSARYNKTHQRKPYDGFVEAYLADYADYLGKYTAPERYRTTATQELEFLTGMAGIERASVERFVRERVLKGHTVQTVRDRAEEAVKSGEIEFSRGWMEILFGGGWEGRESAMRDEGAAMTFRSGIASVHIVTVNWFAEMIRSAVKYHALRRLQSGVGGADQGGISAILDSIPIIGNDLRGLDAADGSTGAIEGTDDEIGRVHTAADKLRAIEAIRKRTGDDSSHDDDRPLYIYIGDSTTDLPALASPHIDVGICIRPEGSETTLTRALARLHIDCAHVSDFREEVQERDADGWSRRAYWARDLAEVTYHVITRSEKGFGLS